MRIVLIDAMNLVFRAQYTSGSLTTEDGKPTGVIYGFIRMLHKVYQKFESSPILIFWEGGYLKVVREGKKFEVEKYDPVWRKDLPRQEYKSNRKIDQSKLDAHAQVPKVQKVLAYLRHPQFSVPKCEGDDLIGIAAIKLAKEVRPEQIAIVSGDRDFLQLVDDHYKIRVYRPTADGLKKYDEKMVETEYGVPAYKFARYKAFVGDGTDHYKGIPGCGPVAARELVLVDADPSLSWVEQPKLVHKGFSKFEKHWRKARDCYKLALIPRTTKHKYFPEGLKADIDKEFKTLTSKLQREFTKEEYDASMELFVRFCARYELNSLLADRKMFFRGSIINGKELQ